MSDTAITTVSALRPALRLVEAQGLDTLVEGMITAFTTLAQDVQRRKFITQTCVDYLDRWPGDAVIRPAWSPLIAVASIAYIAADGTEQTWAEAEYDEDTDTEPGRVTLAYAASFPTIRSQANAITLTYTAGYGALTTDVPQLIRNACAMQIYRWLEQPDGGDGMLCDAVQGILHFNRLVTL